MGTSGQDEQPETMAPDTVAPDIASPETVEPETMAPPPMNPGPGPTMSAMRPPETMTPDSQQD